jgi:phage regulator Rha-like protein
MDKLQIVGVNGENRIDSRLVSKSLGIQHESLMKSIVQQQAKLETLGAFRFQIGSKEDGNTGGKQPKYALLNENQAIFISMMSSNTEQVINFKYELTVAFSAARNALQQQQAPDCGLNNLWSARLRLFNDHTRIPYTHWCIFNEIAHVFWGMEFKGVKMEEKAVPDISVGKLWMKQVRTLQLDEKSILKYPHCYPDKRGKQLANIYPNAWLGEYRDWFNIQYLQQEFKQYMLKHSDRLAIGSGK